MITWKKNLGVMLAAVLGLGTLTGCSATITAEDAVNYANNFMAAYQEMMGEEAVQPEEAAVPEEVTILYTNDVHTYINNQETDDDGNVTKLLSYASVAALKTELESEGKNVILIDAGDHSQGTAFGGMDEGKSIINIMNATGYDLATLGNHEFDYGMFRAFAIMDEANFPYLSCNFYTTGDGNLVLPASQIFEIGGNKIAFIGISTPETITKSTPTYFMDETGTDYLYGFYSGDDGSDLYCAVQAAIDDVKDEADYVIALGHLGVDISSAPYRSTDVIEHVSGLDAFIDGHSHTVLESEEVTDAEGNTVVLSQTGCYLGAIGEMTISTDGTITTQLITEYEGRDELVDAFEQDWIDDVNGKLGEEIATLDNMLYIMDPENPDQRIIRAMETNLGDLNADAYYYYFNEVQGVDCDLALCNGGGIRSNVEPGAMTYLTAKTVNPFGNVACMVESTGQDILDALEMGARKVGLIDEETGAIAEVGGFMQCAGITYEIDTAVASEVELDENNVWQGSPANYRVKNVTVYNKETGEYEPLDLDKTYNVAGINYLLRNQGDGLAMFADNVCVVDYVDEDYLVLSEYLKSFAANDEGMAEVNTANSPLASYDGYLLDYENPFGAGRISIIVE